MQCRALFLSKPNKCHEEKHKVASSLTNIQPFINGQLNESVIEWHPLTISVLNPVLLPSLPSTASDDDDDDDDSTLCLHDEKQKLSDIVEIFGNKGLAVLKLQHYFHPQNNFTENSYDDDDFIRNGVERFWKSSEGSALLQARYLHPSSDLKSKLYVLPTHVTRRKAPPDGMSLVHIDYPDSHDLSKLSTEWWSRWKNILPYHKSVKRYRKRKENTTESEVNAEEHLDAKGFSNLFRLVGVVTNWICLQPEGEKIRDHPLIVADSSSVHRHNSHVYKVGKRHSVGVGYDPEMKWFHAPDMHRGDVWCFDTMKNPHVRVDLNSGDSEFIRESAEVRCLILAERN